MCNTLTQYAQTYELSFLQFCVLVSNSSQIGNIELMHSPLMYNFQKFYISFVDGRVGDFGWFIFTTMLDMFLHTFIPITINPESS